MYHPLCIFNIFQKPSLVTLSYPFFKSMNSMIESLYALFLCSTVFLLFPFHHVVPFAPFTSPSQSTPRGTAGDFTVWGVWLPEGLPSTQGYKFWWDDMLDIFRIFLKKKKSPEKISGPLFRWICLAGIQKVTLTLLFACLTSYVCHTSTLHTSFWSSSSIGFLQMLLSMLVSTALTVCISCSFHRDISLPHSRGATNNYLWKFQYILV